ncbi:dihydrofolate reductase [Escherichia coli]|nr:dihydrofolate reductase [Escherichia coli]
MLLLPVPVGVIGGEQIYSLFMPHVEEIWLSHIGVDVPNADAFFPASMMRNLGYVHVITPYTQRASGEETGFSPILYISP